MLVIAQAVTASVIAWVMIKFADATKRIVDEICDVFEIRGNAGKEEENKWE